MKKEYIYTFEDLLIVPEDLSKLMGFENDTIPDPFTEYINTAIQEASKLCSIKCGFVIFDPIKIDQANKTIQIETETFHPSKIVTTQLKEATKAALFAGTVGSLISEHAAKVSQESDPILGYVFDILGSVAIEKVTDKMQIALLREVQKNELSISDRYSPGYCEWSVGEQQQLFSLLPNNFCGIKLSESSLMHPIKSVSGIIGIGRGLQQKGYQCQWCTDNNCIYGKIKQKK